MMKMEWNFDVVAAVSACLGAVGGALINAFKLGRNEGIVAIKVDNLSEKMTLVCDELARRITVLENRYQYDGLYIQPRPRRDATPAE